MTPSDQFAEFLCRTKQAENLDYFRNTLNDAERDAVARQYFSNVSISWEDLEYRYRSALKTRSHPVESSEFLFTRKSIENDAINVFEKTPKQTTTWKRIGLESIVRGECAVCILAGGQASRLHQGANIPKGCLVLPVLPSQKSLFQIFAEKVQCVEMIALQHAQKQSRSDDAPIPQIPVVILTSQENHHETVTFFEQNDFFGLLENQIFFVTQRMLPALRVCPLNKKSNESISSLNLIFKTKSEIAFAPTGNGAFYEALVQSGVSHKLRSAGVRYIQVSTVDNPLTIMADPVFYGFCIEKNVDAGSKSFTMGCENIGKNVGIFALDKSNFGDEMKWFVREYSEECQNNRQSLSNSNETFALANMAIHCLTLDFCDRSFDRMQEAAQGDHCPYHIAEKRISTGQSSQGFVQGIKLESFIFDAFRYSTNAGILLVEKDAEFAPIKYPDQHPPECSDLQHVPEGTPLAARIAMLRHDLSRLKIGKIDPKTMRLDLDTFAFEVDALLPFLSPSEMIQAELAEKGLE